MKECYLEVTFRKGKPLAAYLYLPRQNGIKSARSEPMGAGMLVDYSAAGDPIGIEITDPRQASLEQINGFLTQIGLKMIKPDDLAPLRAA